VREGTPIADLATVVPGRSTADAAEAILSEPTLSRWLLSTENLSLAACLVRRGAAPKRHSLLMQCDLREHPPSSGGDGRLAFAPLPREATPALWTAILPSWRAAFPPDHPDHFAGDDDMAIAFHLRLVDGSELGPAHRSSTLLLDADGKAVAGIIVNVRPQDPPLGGPWIADLWRDPAEIGAGLGRLLIDHAKTLLVEDGHTKLTLAVTSGNPARRGYERAGFRVFLESQTLLLPEYVHRPRRA